MFSGVDWYLHENFEKVLEVIAKIKNAGNHFYKEKNYQKAVQKYKKSCRYIEHLRTCMGSTEDDEEGKARLSRIFSLYARILRNVI